MSKNTLIPFILFLIFTGVAIWAATDPDISQKKIPQLQELIVHTLGFGNSDDDNIIKTKVNEDFAISLEANPTTGYQWEPDYDERFLEMYNREYNSSFQDSALGAGGRETFHFLPLKPGHIKVTFSYLRPWNKEKIKEIVYRVTIE